MPHLPPFKPDPWRLLLGFVLAPIAGAAVFTMVEGEGDVKLMVPALLYGGYPATIVLGIPAFVVFRHWLRPYLATTALAGGIIAIAPWIILFSIGSSGYGEVESCVTQVDGRMTWCGFVGALRVLAEIFGYGVVGGLVFWICVVWRHEQFEGTSEVKI